MEQKVAKSKKFKLRDGMQKDGKYPNCEIEPKLAKVKNSNCEMEWKMMENIQIARWNPNWQK